MIQPVESEQRATGQGAGLAPMLSGAFDMTASGGFHERFKVGGSPARVEWVQGSSPIASAQFTLAPPEGAPPPPKQITDLTVGENSIPFVGDWGSALVSWSYSDGSGAATFSSTMVGLPAGPSGWNMVSEVIGPQEANFQIAFGSEPTSCLLSLDVLAEPAPDIPALVSVRVDGDYAGTLADGCQIPIEGEVVTLSVDLRGQAVTHLLVVYMLQYESSPGLGPARPGRTAIGSPAAS